MPADAERMKPPLWLPRWPNLALGLLPMLACLVLMGCFAASRWPLWDEAFYSDQSPAAWLSSAQLLGGAFLALRLVADGALPRAWAIGLCAALWWMALDEQFMLHEQWKFGCEAWWSACRWPAVREAPTWLIGLLGAASALGLWRHLREPSSRWLMAAGVALGLLALWVDLAQTPAWLLPLEEALEVLAEALFIGALAVLPRPAQVHS